MKERQREKVGVRMEEKEILREKGRDGRERTRKMEREGEREREWKIKREERERKRNLKEK